MGKKKAPVQNPLIEFYNSYPESLPGKNNNQCMWCNKQFQFLFIHQQEIDRQEHKDEHTAIMKRVNQLTTMTALLFILLLGTGIINLDDLMRYKNVVTDTCGIAVSYLQANI